MDTRPVFNQHDGLTGRDGGPYLDQVEAYNAEVQRAQVEGREPDFDNLGSTAGTPLVPAVVLKHGHNVNSIPSQGNVDATLLAVDAAVNDEDNLLQPKGEGVFPEPRDAFAPAEDEVEDAEVTPADENNEPGF